MTIGEGEVGNERSGARRNRSLLVEPPRQDIYTASQMGTWMQEAEDERPRRSCIGLG